MDSKDQRVIIQEAKSTTNDQANEEIFELKLGTLVYDDKTAFDLYNDYAINKGFSVRKGKIRYKHGTSIVCERIYYCSKEGFKKDEDPSLERKTERLDTRTGCHAQARFKVENGVWELDRIFSEHNHELAPPEQRHLLRSGRKISEASKGIIDSMAAVGIRPTRAYKYLVNEAGGFQNVGFTKDDHHNYVQTEKSKKFESGDAQSLVNFFKRKQVENPMFFYAVQVDEDNRMKNLFWRDGLSKIDFECFGDVVVFDTTYRTNRYNMICAPFVGVNHHWKNVFFGCAFLSDEKKETFVWLLETFRLAMGNKEPKSIFTDQDHAMKSAINEVFPDTQHRLCIWHIMKNAGHHLSSLYSKPGFKAKFTKLFHSCESDLEFECLWKEMIEQWGVDKNKWLKCLYNIRENWCPAFSRDTFSANILSTQRSESTNNVFQQMACKTMTLTEFVKHYDEKAEEMRNDEISADFSCDRGLPYMRVRCAILEHAAEVYTHRVFRMFQNEFLKGVSEQVVDHIINGTSHTYILRKEGQQRSHIVHFNSWNSAIHCECKMFESKGWLCSHALRVLNLNVGVQKIPQQYVLERWTKKAKKEIMMEIFETCNVSKKPSRTIRFNKLMRKAFFVMSLSAEDEETETIAAENLDLILDQIGRYKANSKEMFDLNVHPSGDSTHIQPFGDRPVLDPPRKKAKGEKNVRLRGFLEKVSTKKKKSSKQPVQTQWQPKSERKERTYSKELQTNLSTMSMPMNQNNDDANSMENPSTSRRFLFQNLDAFVD